MLKLRAWTAATIIVVLAASLLGQAVALGQDDSEDTRGLIEAELEIVAPDDAEPEVEAALEDAGGSRLSGTGGRVESGTYDLVLDDPGPEWEVTEIECFSIADSVIVTDPTSRSALIDLAPIDLVSCTFTVASGIAEFLLRVKPEEEDPEVTATITRSEDVFSVGSTELRGGHRVRFPPGSHVATLSVPDPDWIVTEAICLDLLSDETQSSGDVAARQVVAGIDPGEFVQCDFQIEKTGEVTIVTKTQPRGFEDEFTFRVSGEGETDELLSRGVPPTNRTSLRPGVGAAEMSDPGDRWKVESVDCRERDETLLSIGDAAAMAAALGVDPGDRITCTFTVQDQTVPLPGPWRVTETSNRGTCDGIDPEKGRPQNLDLRVGNKGQRISGGPVVLRRVSEDEGKYRGRNNRARIEWAVRSPRRMTGKNTLRLGQGCSIIRNFVMRYQGD